MTEAEKQEIVGLVMTQISSQAVDFDIATEEPKANDLLTAVRETESGGYRGVTIKWDDVARIATELANQAATRAEQAKTDAVTAKNIAQEILTGVQNKGTEITNFVATSKSEIETQKNESVNAVKSVYQTDLNELKGDLDKLNIMSVNRFNKNDLFPTNNRYVDPYNGNILYAEGFNTSGLIYVNDLKSFKMTKVFSGAFYTEDEVYVGGIDYSSYTNVPQNAIYCRICFRTENIDLVQLGENVTDDNYIPFDDIFLLNGVRLSKKQLEEGKIIVYTDLYVGSGKNFESITSALNFIIDNSYYNRYRIHVSKGTYEETFHTKDYVDIIGENPYQTIINYISDDESDYVNRSAIFATSYTKLENLTIETKGSKYPVHCDGAYNIPYEVVIKNCILRHNGFDTLPTQAGTAIGIGLYHGQHVKLIECELDGKNGVYGSADIYCHNSADTDERHSKYRSLRVENCVLGECTYGMRLQAIENNQMQDNDCVLIGNVNNGLTKFFKQSTSKDSWHIRQFGQTWAN